MEKFMFICKSEEHTTVITKEKVGGKKVSNTFNQNQGDAQAGWRQGFHFEQEKLLTLDGEDI